MLISHTTHSLTHTDSTNTQTCIGNNCAHFYFRSAQLIDFPQPLEQQKGSSEISLCADKTRANCVGGGWWRAPAEGANEPNWAELSWAESSRGGGRVTCVRRAGVWRRQQRSMIPSAAVNRISTLVVYHLWGVATGNGNCLAKQRAFAADKDTPRTTPNVEHSSHSRHSSLRSWADPDDDDAGNGWSGFLVGLRPACPVSIRVRGWTEQVLVVFGVESCCWCTYVDPQLAKGVADVAAVAVAASKMAPTAKLANMWQLPLITCTVREGGTGSGTDGRHLAKKCKCCISTPKKKEKLQA